MEGAPLQLLGCRVQMKKERVRAQCAQTPQQEGALRSQLMLGLMIGSSPCASCSSCPFWWMNLAQLRPAGQVRPQEVASLEQVFALLEGQKLQVARPEKKSLSQQLPVPPSALSHFHSIKLRWMHLPLAPKPSPGLVLRRVWGQKTHPR